MMNDWRETLEWYEKNQTARQIGYNPDGMCLKVCRDARAIGPVYPSAKVAQDATPEKYRVYKVRDLRRGMVLYFDDPNDWNRYGHVATMIGRVPGFDPDDLNDVLVETNSVKKGELVVVRASYFQKYWGDPFRFGATYLNGMVLDVPGRQSRVQVFRRSGPNFNVRLLDRAAEAGRRDVAYALRRIDEALEELPKDKRRRRIQRFVEDYEEKRILRMTLLNEIVQTTDSDGKVRRVRNKLRQILKSLPES